jgi:hypothetical protein
LQLRVFTQPGPFADVPNASAVDNNVHLFKRWPYFMRASTPQSATLAADGTNFVKFSNFERFVDGSGYRAQLEVVDGSLACTGIPFYFEKLTYFVEVLQLAHATLSGFAQLGQRFEDDFVRVEFKTGGHLAISGLLKQGVESSLRFDFLTDQTFCSSFISELQNVLQALHR